MIKFDVQMTPRIMYNFMIHHTYTSLSGILGVVFGVLSLIIGLYRQTQGTGDSWMFFVFAAVFIIYMPVTLWLKSAKQVKTTPMFQKPITYEMTETGLVISQGDQSTENAWDNFQKVISTKQSLLLYISKVRAIVLPKEQMGEQYTAAVKWISTHVDPAKVNIKDVT